MVKCIDIKDFNVYYGIFKVVEDVMMIVELWLVMVFIGLFGCGKFIFLCIFNCMYEVVVGVCVEGLVCFDDCDLYVCDVDFVVVCCIVGMVF